MLAIGFLIGYSVPFLAALAQLKKDPDLRQKIYDSFAEQFIDNGDWDSLRELNWSSIYKGCKKRMTDLTGSCDDDSY